jgi:hypothetical protein
LIPDFPQLAAALPAQKKITTGCQQLEDPACGGIHHIYLIIELKTSRA